MAPAAAMAARAERLTRVVDPALAALAGGGGGADSVPNLNEADPALPYMVRVTYGPHLERLRRVQAAAYGPDDIFYGYAVGSDAWAPHAQGRLCRAGYTFNPEFSLLLQHFCYYDIGY